MRCLWKNGVIWPCSRLSRSFWIPQNFLTTFYKIDKFVIGPFEIICQRSIFFKISKEFVRASIKF